MILDYLHRGLCFPLVVFRKSEVFFSEKVDSRELKCWIIDGIVVFLVSMIILLVSRKVQKSGIAEKEGKVLSNECSKVKSGKRDFPESEYIEDRETRHSTFRDKTEERRAYYRINESLGITFRLGHKEYKCEANDISGGGVSFYTDIDTDKIKPSTMLMNMTFTLPNYGKVVANAIVMRVERFNEEGSMCKCLCGTEFVHISDSSREMIIRYIHSKQRVNIRKSQSDDTKKMDKEESRL